MNRRNGVYTDQENMEIIERMEKRQSYQQIAAAMGRTRAGVKRHASDLGTGLWTADGRTMRSTAALLGVSISVFRDWVKAGRIRSSAITLGTGKHPMITRMISHDDLIAFLDDESQWQLWEPSVIVDSGLREWAVELRRGKAFLSVKDAAGRLFLTEQGVWDAIRRGALRAVHDVAKHWWIREDWLHITYKRGRPPREPRGLITRPESVTVLHQWGRKSLAAIASDLGVSSSTVARVGLRLGLQSVGQGRRPWRMEATRAYVPGSEA
jgi:hypothetical protein